MSLLKVFLITLLALVHTSLARTCTLNPLGVGQDDTDQVLSAVEICGTNGRVVLESGSYNITRKMTWNLNNAVVDLYGTLTFIPDIKYWFNSSSTYRVVYIQDQASWFVVTGNNFVIDAHKQGGIDGNGQTWYNFYPTYTKADGDGRPITLTLSHVKKATIRDFHIASPPFWCNTIADSSDVVYDGMVCNATNTNPAYAGRNVVPNTDGVNVYRSDNIRMLNWDYTGGDDCLALKGNATNVLARNFTCRGGNGIAIGSLGQYTNVTDIVENVTIENATVARLPPNILSTMNYGVYFKTYTGTVHGSPPTGGGGGLGYVRNVTVRNIKLDNVTKPLYMYQTMNSQTGDVSSKMQYSYISFSNWSGYASGDTMVDIRCSSGAPCSNITFSNFDVDTGSGGPPKYICRSVISEPTGLDAPCNITGVP